MLERALALNACVAPVCSPNLPRRAPPVGARGHEQDVAAVLLIARGRVLLATALVLGATLVGAQGGGADVLLAIGGYLWVPFASVLALAASVNTVRPVRVAGAIGDLAMLVALDSLVADAATVALAGYSLVVVLGAYTGGRQFGLFLGGAAMALVLLGEYAATPADRLDGSVIALFGVTLALLLVVVDRAASEQRRAEARSAHLATKAEAILARVADGVVVTNALGVMVEANPAAERMVGMPSLEGHCSEVLGLCEGERKLDCSTGCGLLSLAAGEPGSILGHEVWRARPDGTRQPLLANAAPLLDEQGQLVEVVHSLRDITRLKQADEAKTLFLATASHELKTPLTVISGFAETLQREDVSDVLRRRGLEAISDRARELTGIVERLLLSSRIESGRLTIATRPIDLYPILRERTDAMASATGREVILMTPEKIPPVQADVAAVATIVDHLVDNAIKYSPGGGPVLVGVIVDAAQVRIEVNDSGVGMDEEAAAHCFEKFWQADSTDRRRFGGTGIGLYVVSSLAESMGGSTSVRSALSEGSTFSVVLQRADGRSEDGAAGESGQVLVGERSMVREFMRQLGVPESSGVPQP